MTHCAYLFSDDEDDAPPDFSLLPEVTWVSIMSFLPLSDRGRLARTCRALEASFCHPSLWYAVTVTLHGDTGRRNCVGRTAASYVPMVERFGAYFQDLTLIVHGYDMKMTPDCEAVVACLGRCCRYERLTLDVRSLVRSRDIVGDLEPRTTDLDVLARLVADAYRLRTFELRAWPVYPRVRSVDMLAALQSNDKLRGCLERLSLYWQSADNSTWVSLNTVVPSPAQMLAATAHFTRLRALYVRSSMLSDDLIVDLADSRHAPLQRLGILVTYSSSRSDGEIPRIEATSWGRLRAYSPSLQVHVTVMTRMPADKLSDMLMPEMPVTAVSFMRYSQCGATNIRSITDKFCASLHKFVDYSDASGLDADIVAMATKCSHLDYLVYNGTLRSSTVRELARLRGGRWVHFRINMDNVVTREADLEDDDDVIIKKGDDNSCYVVKIRQLAEAAADNRTEAIDQLTADVTSCIGRKCFSKNKLQFSDVGNDLTSCMKKSG